MAPKPTLKSHKFQLLMTAEEHAQLVHLAELTNRPAAAVLRDAIAAHHGHAFGGAFQCANGHPCKIPQCHYAPPPQVAASAPVDPTGHPLPPAA